MIATLASVIVFSIILIILTPYFLLSLILGIFAVLAVFKAIFEVNWLKAIAIAILAVIMFMIISLTLALLGIGIASLIKLI